MEPGMGSSARVLRSRMNCAILRLDPSSHLVAVGEVDKRRGWRIYRNHRSDGETTARQRQFAGAATPASRDYSPPASIQQRRPQVRRRLGMAAGTLFFLELGWEKDWAWGEAESMGSLAAWAQHASDGPASIQRRPHTVLCLYEE